MWFRELRFNIKYLVENIWERDWLEARYNFWKLRSDLFYPIENLFRQTKVIMQYIPTLWQDRDWDHHYLLKLMKYKLIRMEKCIRNGSHVDCEKDADIIQSTIDVIDRILKDEYMSSLMHEHELKWGKSEFEFKEITGNKKKKDQLFSMESKHANANTQEEKEQERKEFGEMCKLAEQMTNNDYHVLFSTLEKNIRNWWD